MSQPTESEKNAFRRALAQIWEQILQARRSHPPPLWVQDLELDDRGEVKSMRESAIFGSDVLPFVRAIVRSALTNNPTLRDSIDPEKNVAGWHIAWDSPTRRRVMTLEEIIDVVIRKLKHAGFDLGFTELPYFDGSDDRDFSEEKFAQLIKESDKILADMFSAPAFIMEKIASEYTQEIIKDGQRRRRPIDWETEITTMEQKRAKLNELIGIVLTDEKANELLELFNGNVESAAVYILEGDRARLGRFISPTTRSRIPVTLLERPPENVNLSHLPVVTQQKPADFALTVLRQNPELINQPNFPQGLMAEMWKSGYKDLTEAQLKAQLEQLQGQQGQQTQTVGKQNNQPNNNNSNNIDWEWAEEEFKRILATKTKKEKERREEWRERKKMQRENKTKKTGGRRRKKRKKTRKGKKKKNRKKTRKQ